jgi:hypothetical protein
MLVFGLAELEYVSLQRWEEAGELALGLWLIASPFTFGYAGTGELRLTFHPWRSRRAASAAGTLAGLDAERQGACPARVIANRELYAQDRHWRLMVARSTSPVAMPVRFKAAQAASAGPFGHRHGGAILSDVRLAVMASFSHAMTWEAAYVAG